MPRNDEFDNIMEELNPEATLQVSGQSTGFATAALEDLEGMHAATLAANARSLEATHRLDLEVLSILSKELGGDVSPRERLRLLDEIRDVRERALEKDSENKAFLAKQLTKKMAATMAIVGLALILLRGRAGVETRSTGSSLPSLAAHSGRR